MLFRPALLLLLCLTACASPPVGFPCSQFHRIDSSPLDTQETRQAVAAYDARWDAECRWVAPR